MKNRNRLTWLMLGLAGIVMSCVPMATATTLTWDGGGGADSNWTTAANWDPDQIPTTSDSCYITNGYTAYSTGGQVGYLYLGGTNTTGNLLHTAGTLQGFAEWNVNNGTIDQTGGTIQGVGLFFLNPETNKTATYNMYGGNFLVNYIVISEAPYRGTAVFNHYAGNVYHLASAVPMFIAYHSTGAKGTYNFFNGSLQIATALLRLGQDGILNIGDATNAPTIAEYHGGGWGGNNRIENVGGLIQGVGFIQSSDYIDMSDWASGLNDGRVIADGWGKAEDRSLSFTNLVNGVRNSVDINPTGTGGWYAVNRAALALPKIAVATGTNAYNWGEGLSDGSVDTTPDLVNSLLLSFTNVATGDNLGIRLLATDRSDVPRTTHRTLIGVWDFNMGPSFAFGTGGSMNLTFRYNHMVALPSGKSETDLKLFHSNGSVWNEIAGSPNTNLHTISVSGVTNSITGFSYFAVGIPPPSGTIISFH